MQPKESLVGFGSKHCAMNPLSLDHYAVSLDIKLRCLPRCLILDFEFAAARDPLDTSPKFPLLQICLI